MTHWLRKELKRIGRTQTELAEQVLHRNPSAVTAIVEGRQPVRLDQLEPISRFLGVTVADILAYEGIATGLPAVDADLLTRCLAAALADGGDLTPDQLAFMTITAYNQVQQNQDLKPHVNALVKSMMLFAAGQRPDVQQGRI